MRRGIVFAGAAVPRLAVAVAAAVLLLAAAVLAAPSSSPSSARLLRYACARDHTGLMRYVASASGCEPGTEGLLRIARDRPLDACVGARPHFGEATGPRGNRVLIPAGSTWHVSGLSRCPRGQLALTLPGGAPIHFCALQRDGLLLHADGPGRCGSGELALIVPAGPRGTPRRGKPTSAKPPGKPPHELPHELPHETPHEPPHEPPHETPPGHQPPTANAQSVEVDEDASVAIALSATAHPANDPLTYTVASAPSHGTLSGTPPKVTYTPAPGYHGADQFTFTAADGSLVSAPATVSIAVAPVVYDHAVADAYATGENHKLTKNAAEGVLANDTDSKGLTLNAELVQGPTHGTLTLNADGSFEYQPTPLFKGTDTFTYRDNDGNTPSNEATVTITVEPEVFDHATNDSYSLEENKTLTVTAPGVLANDTDSESLPLTAELVGGPAHGTLTLNADGSFQYTPAAGFFGADSFIYRDGDGNSPSNTATVALTVEQVNQAPVLKAPGAQKVNGGATLTFSSGDLDPISVEDVDAGGAVEQLILKAGHGTLKLGSVAGLESASGNETGEVTLKGTLAALNGALEGLAYTAEVHYGGPDTLALEADDLGHTGLGGAKTTTAGVAIEVEHANEAPTLSLPAAKEATENTPLVFSVAEADALTVADADSGGGAEQVKLAVAHGTLTLGATAGLTSSAGNGSGAVTLEGTLAALNGALDGLTYTPTANYSGADKLTAEIDDLGNTGTGGAKTASGEVALTVVHPPPVPINPTFKGAIGNTELAVGETPVGVPVVDDSGSLLPSPAEETDGSTLSVAAETIATAHGGTVSVNADGTFTYQPPAGFEGASDTFQYTEDDSRGAHATGTATIEVDNKRVWYVNDTLATNGSGTSSSPFDELSSVGAVSGEGDVIFLYGGGVKYVGGIALKAHETLDGQSDGLTVEGDPLVSAAGSNPVVANGAGPAITLAEGTAVDGITVTGTSGVGIAASGVGTFALDAKVSISTTTGAGLEVSGGSGTIADAATISTSGAHSLAIQNRTGGTVTASGPITDTGSGILLGANTGATIDLTGKLELSTGTHAAFAATGGGTVDATDAENTAATTTGTAVDVLNTTIAAGGLRFRSVSANGAANGIDLENTGAGGGLTVSGAGSAGSGGTIASATGSGTAGIGVYLDRTNAPSLSYMHIHDAANFALFGQTVSGLTLAHDQIDGTNGGAATSEPASVALQQLTGSATISESTITGGYEDDIRIDNSSGTLSPLTLAGDTIGEERSEGDDALNITPSGTATVNPTIENTDFTAARGDVFQLNDEERASSELVLTGDTVTNDNPNIVSGGGGVTLTAGGAGSTAKLVYDIERDSFEGSHGNAVAIGAATGTPKVEGTFADNVIGGTFSGPGHTGTGVVGATDSGSSEGSDLSIAGSSSLSAGGALTSDVHDNFLFEYNNFGAHLQSDGTETANFTFAKNTVGHAGSDANLFVGNGLFFSVGPTSGATANACFDPNANTLAGSGFGNGTENIDVLIRRRNSATLRIPGYQGATTSATEVSSYVAARNDSPVVSTSLGAGGSVADDTSGLPGTPCAQPPIP